MGRVKIKDKEFEIFIPEAHLQESIKFIAEKICREMCNKNPLIIGVLNGSFMFMSDLIKNIHIDCEVSFVKVASYSGTSSLGKVKELIGFNESVKGRTVLIVEDIVDTGNTLEMILDSIAAHEPSDVKIATLLYKPDAFTKKYKLDYVVKEIPNEFIVGYGLDYDGYGRNLRDIYKIIEQ